MRIRACAVLVLLVPFLAGCPPTSLLRSQRRVSVVEAGAGVDAGKGRLVSTHDDLAAAASRFTERLESLDFELLNASDSFGLVPWTGHTENLTFTYTPNPDVVVVLTMSKGKFDCEILQYETEPKSGIYDLDEDEARRLEEAARQIRELAAEVFPGRAVRVSRVHYADVDAGEGQEAGENQSRGKAERAEAAGA